MIETPPMPVAPATTAAARPDVGQLGVVGVLGGMGPLATIDFMHKMLLATPAASDQEHVPVVVSSIPQVPDRTEAFCGAGDSPVAAMVASAQRLVHAGAGLVVISCNTAHLWFDDVRAAIGLPMLHLVDAALQDAITDAGPNAHIGLLATDATLASGLYINRTPLLPGAGAIQWVLPTAHEVIEWVMPGIAAVKAGDLPQGAALLLQAAKALQRRGANCLILGCTEIPLVLDSSNAPLPVIDATAALARRAVNWSRAQRSPLA